MTTEIFEFRRQAREPWTYIAFAALVGALYLGWSQGLALVTVLFCGPALGYILARLVENKAEGFRIGPDGIILFRDDMEATCPMRDIASVALARDAAGGTLCRLQLRSGRAVELPAASAFAPDILADEFRLRNIPVWIDRADTRALAAG